MKALITAAGKGTRMQVNEDTNKCLLVVGHKSLIENSIDALKGKNINDIYIITGQGREKMEQAVGKEAHCIFNPEYASKGIIVSIARAKEQLYGEPFLLITGDLYYDPDMIDVCMSLDDDVVISYEAKSTYTKEDSKLSMDDGLIIKMGKDIPPEETSGEFGHMMKVSATGSKLLFDKIDEYIQKGDANVYLMDIINALIHDEVQVVPVSVAGFLRIEIDFPEELTHAREDIHPQLAKKQRKE